MGKNTQMNMDVLMKIAADRADMLVDDGTGTPVWSSFATSAAVGAFVNFEFAALWDALINANEDYCVYRHTIDVKANQEDYLLPDDFYKFRKVFPIVNGRRCAALRKFQMRELGEADSLAAILTSPIEETKYAVIGSRLRLHPIPSGAATLELWYIPQYPGVDNLEDLVPLQFPLGWEDYVIEGIAARMLEKEESDATPFRARQKEILQRILIMVEDRDVGEPFQMQDTEGYL